MPMNTTQCCEKNPHRTPKSRNQIKNKKINFKNNNPTKRLNIKHNSEKKKQHRNNWKTDTQQKTHKNINKKKTNQHIEKKETLLQNADFEGRTWEIC